MSGDIVLFLELLGTVVEYRNLESGQHIKRVKGFTKLLAEQIAKLYPEYGLTPKQINVIVAASALHDVGKIAISDAILLKPGRLTKKQKQAILNTLPGGVAILRGWWGTRFLFQLRLWPLRMCMMRW